MGILDFLNKAKETVVAAKDMAVQAAKDNKQMRDEADIEAAGWKSFDPLILKDVLHDKYDHAVDLYVKQTGCTPEKAKAVMNRIRKSVKTEYPGILHAQACAADMEAIKDLWPFGTESFNMYLIFQKEEDDEMETVAVLPARLKTNGKGEYTLKATHITSFMTKTKEEYKWNAIFKNGKLYLKDEAGNVTLVNSLSFNLDQTALLLFNPEDERYKTITSKLEAAKRIKTLHLYRKSDFEKFLNGEMDCETLTNIADSFTFTFKNESIYSSGCNVGTLFKDVFFSLNVLLDVLKDNKNLANDVFNKEMYDYIHNNGVEYAWDDDDFEEQFSRFKREVHTEYIIDNRTKWNAVVYGAGGMIYQGLSARIKQSSIPVDLGEVSWSEQKEEITFTIKDSVFNYYYEMPDERPMLDRVIGYNEDAADNIANEYKKFQASIKETIISGMNLFMRNCTITIENGKYVTFHCCNKDYCGFIEEIEYC